MRYSSAWIMLLLPVLVHAGESAPSYVDHAEVLAVRPVHVRAATPLTREQCDQPAAPVRAGDLRAGRPSLTLGDALREDLREQRVCRTVTALESKETVSGYDVTYRYAGRSYTRRMDHDPGERVKVRVDIAVPALR